MSNNKLLDRQKEIEIKQANFIDNKQLEDNKNKKPEGLNKFNLIWGISNIVLSTFLILLVTPAVRTLIGIQKTEEVGQIESKVLTVQTVKIQQQQSYQVSRSYSGKIVANRTSELGFDRSGKLLKIAVQEGEIVKKGTPLAYLDTRSLKVKEKELIAQREQAIAKLREMKAGPRAETINAARASVRDLESQLNLAQRKQTRRERLFAERAISNEQLDEVIFEERRIRARLEETQSKLNELLAGTRPEVIQGQQARVAQLNAILENLRIEIKESVLIAPFEGTISTRRVDEGSAVSIAQPILRLIENKKIEAKIGIPVTTTSQIEIGSSQNLEINGKNYRAIVSSILPELDSSNGTVTVVLTLDKNQFQDIWPGQVAKLSVTKNISGTGYWVPTTALVKANRGLWAAYLLGEIQPGVQDAFTVEKKYVEVIHSESERVFVRGALQPDDRIIINGTHRLVSGQLVIPFQGDKGLDYKL